VGTQALSMRTAHYEMQKKELNVIVSSYSGQMLFNSKMDLELLSQMEKKYLSHIFPKDGSKSDVKVTIDIFQNILLQKW
jgi:fatty acid/phospholipid biosynthesis enzyme